MTHLIALIKNALFQSKEVPLPDCNSTSVLRERDIHASSGSGPSAAVNNHNEAESEAAFLHWRTKILFSFPAT